MKAYGVDRKDRGCCPDHDKFPNDCYNSRASEHARAKRIAHKRARARATVELRRISENSTSDMVG